MNPQQDEIDLREYVSTGSRDALNSLARRHLNFVYGVARRETGDEHQAEDVTQAVFIVLSRSAVKIKPASLCGWLFITTRNVAANARKASARRQFHERRAAELKSEHVMNASQGQEDAAHLGHHLLAALAAVRESDRSIVIMRHVHGLEIADVSAAAGMSEAATRKRLERAMEKLRRFLTGRGVTAGSATLCATLAGVTAEAAPPTLSAAVMGGTASGAAAAALAKSTTAAMAWSHMKVAASVLLVVSLLTITAAESWMRMSRRATATIAEAATAQIKIPTTLPATAPSRASANLTYTGVVTGPDGKPVAGVRVFSLIWNADPLQARNLESETTTDADGKYALPGLSASPGPAARPTDPLQRTIVFDKTGFAIAWRESRRDDQTAIETGGAIDTAILLQKPMPIAVRVVDAGSKPIAGAQVSIALQDGGIFARDRQRIPYGYLTVPVLPDILKTDAQGIATFDRIPETSRAHVRVSHPDYARFSSNDGYRGDQYPIRAGGGAYVATLQPGGRIRVHVPMREGQPLLRSAQLGADSEPPSGQAANAWAAFEADGSYLFSGLRPGTYSVRALPFLRNSNSNALIWPATKGVVVTAAQTTDATLTPITGQRVTGRLIDARTKLPMPNVVVSAQQSSGQTYCDAQGQFTLYALPGPNTLAYSTYQTGNITRTQKSFIVNADGPTALGDIETIGPPMIRGRVLDPLGKPVAGGRVTGTMLSDKVTTAADGSFALPLGRRVSADEPNFLFAHNAEGTLGKGVVFDEKFIDPKLALPGAELPTITLAGTAMITGTVADPDGNPTSQVEVSLNVSSPGARMSASYTNPPWGGFTREANRFTFTNVPLGAEMSIGIHRNNADAGAPLANLNPGELRDVGELTLKVRENRPTARGPVQPAPPSDPATFSATLTGVIVDDETDKPLMGARIDGLPQQASMSSYPIDYADQDGRFYLKSLPKNSRIQLIVQSSGYRELREVVDVAAPDLKLRLKTLGANLIGKPAPQWAIANWIGGQSLELSNLKGKVVLLHMGISVRDNYAGLIDYDVLSRAASTYGPSGLVVIGINRGPSGTPSDDIAINQLSEYVKVSKIPYPIAIDSRRTTRPARGETTIDLTPGETHARYAITNEMTMVLIDKQGILRAYPRREKLAEWVEKLLAE